MAASLDRSWDGPVACPYCGEPFDPRDRDSATTRARGWCGRMRFCSAECRELYSRRALGLDTVPYPGEILADGFALMSAAESSE